MALARCRHCLAHVIPDDPRCPVCGGADPSGRRFALLGSVFLGGLSCAAAVEMFAAGLRCKWHRWAGLFGDPDDPDVAGNATDTAVIVGVLVFLLGSLAAATLIHKWFRFR